MRYELLARRSVPGVTIRGGALWLSELFAVLAVVGVFAMLSVCGALIRYNAARIVAANETIARLEREEIELRHALEELQGREQLRRAVRTAVGSRVPERTVNQLVELVDRSSRQYGYDPLLLLAVIRVESYYNPRARGRYRSGRESGAIGLMQLQLETAQIIGRDIGVPVRRERDLYDPHVNAALGVAYLTKLIGQFQSFKLGLLAYNQGPAVVRQNIRERRPLSLAYYERVLAAYHTLRRRVRPTVTASWE